MEKRVTARKAYAAGLEKKYRVLINQCPECGGTGKLAGQDCSVCDNQPDENILQIEARKQIIANGVREFGSTTVTAWLKDPAKLAFINAMAAQVRR